MNNHLSTITVHLPQDHLLSRGFIHELVQHCPDLKSVIFDCDGPTRCMEETLVEFLPKLSRLEEVTLPYLSITSAVTFALSNLPLLEKIAFVDYIIYPEDTEASSLDELRNFLPVLHNNPFPSLKKLSLTANLSNLTAFLRKGIAPCLEFLSVKAVDLENEYSLQSFLTFLSEGRTRSSLTKLVVDMVPYHADAHSVIRTNKEDVGNISFANLEPISCLSSLTYLRIFYHRACKVTDEELVTLVGSLPSLTNLTFCPDPCNLQEKPSLTLKVLPLLAARLPHLEELGLQVDLDSTSELQEVSRPTSFQKLTELNFGTSVVLSDGADWKNIALYLSRLLPSSCTITSGSYLWSPSMETAIGEEFPDVYLPEECEERWDKIADTMYLIIKGREEERKWSTLV
ncbi:hypothetical protein EW145_g4103 [Phellinidium pouzarii]|uniref:F-box domain-containing protein n=1 Tax=Phellinidium pouzarii TaxID=167371 RepID=A0A4S4L4P9_9AGAM|nr:hypothetical protein EW145_g4103 [Phellinidium pouzarii]